MCDPINTSPMWACVVSFVSTSVGEIGCYKKGFVFCIGPEMGAITVVSRTKKYLN